MTIFLNIESFISRICVKLEYKYKNSLNINIKL